MKTKLATVGIYAFIVLIWSLAIGATWELYKVVTSPTVNCSNWENTPLDQVPSECVRMYIK